MTDFAPLTSLSHVNAAIVKGALEAEGVHVILDNTGIGNPYALETGTWATHLMVPRAQLSKAQAVLASFEDDPTPRATRTGPATDDPR